MEDSEVTGHKRLWRAVLDAALSDLATLDRQAIKSAAPKKLIEARHKLAEWFNDREGRFHWICEGTRLCERTIRRMVNTPGLLLQRVAELQARAVERRATQDTRRTEREARAAA